jgi:hypothetical protein
LKKRIDDASAAPGLENERKNISHQYFHFIFYFIFIAWKYFELVLKLKTMFLSYDPVSFTDLEFCLQNDCF